jgi:type II secretory pathway component PulC
MNDNISPEEKLLRLIRGKKEKDLKTYPQKPTYPSIQKGLPFLPLKKLIWLAFGASCIYLIASFIYPWVALKEIKLPKTTPQKVIAPKIEPRQQIKPYESYLEGIKDRQIFSGSTTSDTEKPLSSVSLDLIKDISLVGIISGENPVGIIEDKKTQKTYYLSKGQFMGEFQVEDIKEGKIILNYKGQRFELYL